MPNQHACCAAPPSETKRPWNFGEHVSSGKTYIWVVSLCFYVSVYVLWTFRKFGRILWIHMYSYAFQHVYMCFACVFDVVRTMYIYHMHILTCRWYVNNLVFERCWMLTKCHSDEVTMLSIKKVSVQSKLLKDLQCKTLQDLQSKLLKDLQSKLLKGCNLSCWKLCNPWWAAA